MINDINYHNAFFNFYAFKKLLTVPNVVLILFCSVFNLPQLLRHGQRVMTTANKAAVSKNKFSLLNIKS